MIELLQRLGKTGFKPLEMQGKLCLEVMYFLSFHNYLKVKWYIRQLKMHVGNWLNTLVLVLMLLINICFHS